MPTPHAAFMGRPESCLERQNFCRTADGATPAAAVWHCVCGRGWAWHVSWALAACSRPAPTPCSNAGAIGGHAMATGLWATAAGGHALRARARMSGAGRLAPAASPAGGLPAVPRCRRGSWGRHGAVRHGQQACRMWATAGRHGREGQSAPAWPAESRQRRVATSAPCCLPPLGGRPGLHAHVRGRFQVTQHPPWAGARHVFGAGRPCPHRACARGRGPRRCRRGGGSLSAPAIAARCPLSQPAARYRSPLSAIAARCPLSPQPAARYRSPRLRWLRLPPAGAASPCTPAPSIPITWAAGALGWPPGRRPAGLAPRTVPRASIRHAAAASWAAYGCEPAWFHGWAVCAAAARACLAWPSGPWGTCAGAGAGARIRRGAGARIRRWLCRRGCWRRRRCCWLCWRCWLRWRCCWRCRWCWRCWWCWLRSAGGRRPLNAAAAASL